MAEGAFTEQLWAQTWQAICTVRRAPCMAVFAPVWAYRLSYTPAACTPPGPRVPPKLPHTSCPAFQVWASKWTDRAWLSRRAQNIPDADLSMAVLLQPIVPADYAFVLHSADPLTGRRGTVHGEVVLGMGEALVGNSAGRALAFSADSGARGTAGDAVLLTLPSKRLGLYPDPGRAPLIARSDSNGEDLEAFAGAGLYESMPLSPLLPRTLDYASEPLVWDAGFRADLLRRLTGLAAGVEAAFDGVPQDIEGVLSDGKLYVVQARPQVVQS